MQSFMFSSPQLQMSAPTAFALGLDDEGHAIEQREQRFEEELNRTNTPDDAAPSPKKRRLTIARPRESTVGPPEVAPMEVDLRPTPSQVPHPPLSREKRDKGCGLGRSTASVVARRRPRKWAAAAGATRARRRRSARRP